MCCSRFPCGSGTTQLCIVWHDTAFNLQLPRRVKLFPLVWAARHGGRPHGPLGATHGASPWPSCCLPTSRLHAAAPSVIHPPATPRFPRAIRVPSRHALHPADAYLLPSAPPCSLRCSRRAPPPAPSSPHPHPGTELMSTALPRSGKAHSPWATRPATQAHGCVRSSPHPPDSPTHPTPPTPASLGAHPSRPSPSAGSSAC